MTNLRSSCPDPSYNYQPLAPQTIRVLELHPGAPEAPLVGNITIQHIGARDYEALSYVWGDPAPVASIKCIDATNEGHLGVCRGLVSLLVAFRLPDQVRRVWIDALCINQDDTPERESQVRLMGAVYSQAKNVLCWLGPFKSSDNGGPGYKKEHAAAGASARLAICFLRRFNSNPMNTYEMLVNIYMLEMTSQTALQPTPCSTLGLQSKSSSTWNTFIGHG